ncbi:MAG TPA: MlaD family protein [Candidatus Binatia bacterium]|jgi:paraquat-inducible protein B
MPEPETTPAPNVPQARVVRRGRLSRVWIVPVVAALAGAWIAVTKVMSEGPTVTIQFKTAEGIEAGKTKIKYNGVEIGTLQTVKLSDDHRSAVATARMEPDTEHFLVEDTRFWVVRPRISGASVSGLGTLISGAFVTLDIGDSKKSQREFLALELPPVVAREEPGREFVLKAPDLGSLDAGTPLFFRRIKVGEVTSYELAKDSKTLAVKVFVLSPYDELVTANTRFWNASGVDVSLTASGLNVQTESALSVLIGGIAFETPSTGVDLPESDVDSVFPLYENHEAAFRTPAHDPQTFVLVFHQSVRGLAPGAPVEFRGIPIGEVVSVDAELDAKSFDFRAPVTISLDAQRLGVHVISLEPGADPDAVRRNVIDSMVLHGVRAQLETGNLLTGALYVSFDTFPDAPPAMIDWSHKPPRMPTVSGQLETMEASVSSILNKVDKIPFETLGTDLQKSVADLDRTLATANAALVSAKGALDNTGRLVEPNSQLTTDLGNTLRSVDDAANSVRVLADYLERHPESLIRGKPQGTK